MNRRSSLRWTLVKVGGAVSLLLFLTWLGSARWKTGYTGQTLYLGLIHGSMVLDHYPAGLPTLYPTQFVGWHLTPFNFPLPSRILSIQNRAAASTNSGRVVWLPLWIPFAVIAPPTFLLWLIARRSEPRRSTFRSRRVMILSGVLVCLALTLADGMFGLLRIYPALWALWIAASGLTIALWLTDRKLYLLGHCQKCGYNLTGNVTRTCPECGTAIALEPDASGSTDMLNSEKPIRVRSASE